MAGAVLLCVAWTSIALWHDNLPLLIAMMVLHGLGQSIVFAAAPMLITNATPSGRTSEANGLSNVFRQTAIAIGTQVISLVLAMNSVAGAEWGRVLILRKAALSPPSASSLRRVCYAWSPRSPFASARRFQRP